jgi:hypothetical protein
MKKCIQINKTNWLQHVERSENCRLSQCTWAINEKEEWALEDVGRDGKSVELEQARRPSS